MPDPYNDGRFGIDSDPMNYPGGETGAAAFARENRGRGFIDERNRNFWDILLGRPGRERQFNSPQASGPPVDVHPNPTDEGRFPPQAAAPPPPTAKPVTKISSGSAIAQRMRDLIKQSPLDPYAFEGPPTPAIDWSGVMPPPDTANLPPYDLPPYMRMPYGQEDLQRPMPPVGDRRFGGHTFGGNRFGGNEFGGARFGGNEFGASARGPGEVYDMPPAPRDMPPIRLQRPPVRDLPPYELPPGAMAPYSEEELRRPVTPYGGQRFGGNRFGGNLFGGRMFGPQAEAHADGGPIHMMRGGYPELYTKPVRQGYFATGGETNYVGPDGRGDGRSDHIDAKLSPGEYVMDAETTALLGDGDGQAGARKFDKMREDIRRQKGKKLAKGEISPKAKKNAVEYLARDPIRDGMRNVGR